MKQYQPNAEILAANETRKEWTMPEEWLWFAVLRGAILGAHGAVRAAGSAQRRRYVLEDRSWFASRSTAPGAYLWVCRCLGLDADGILARLHSGGALSGGVVFRVGGVSFSYSTRRNTEKPAWLERKNRKKRSTGHG